MKNLLGPDLELDQVQIDEMELNERVF